ncbi:hypothetical protein BT96DRAFT_944547 [Gymnopus androsaceus JB14]|uniref:Uncharacterized protein n=1 Tax=Gymnopus androsaceus JB14 TaxID=1447944 RepID=A0A6A4H3C9_9AGAR|nr:hypothetical protein BT96DRAFT_944547 [Gymnopus androsaceus JB14]
MLIKTLALVLGASSLASAAINAYVKVNGWLQAELEMEGNGLAGHIHDFDPDITEGTWIGGDYPSYSDLNEAIPYWFNALVPLAYFPDNHNTGPGNLVILEIITHNGGQFFGALAYYDDELLMVQVHQIASSIIANQLDDGWIGPETDPNTRTFWARYPVSLGFMNLNNYTDYWYLEDDELQPEDFTQWGPVEPKANVMRD